MNWWLIGFGILAAVCAGGCFWYRRTLGGEIALMAATPTSRAADVAKLDPGGLVEVIGTLRCQNPLKAEFSGQACAYHNSKIEREEVHYEKDSQGKSERKTRSTTLHSNIRYAPCAVEDASGTVALDLHGTAVEGEQVVNRREREQQGVAQTVLSLAAGTGNADLIRTETILAVDIPVYVLGEVQADRSVGQPAKGSKNKIFIVSNKSKAERIKSLSSTMVWLLVIGIVLAAVAFGLIGWGLSPSA
jgi:hypothetical protein